MRKLTTVLLVAAVALVFLPIRALAETYTHGYLRYEVPTTQGVAYYLREEKAPHGHLVDPYPTDYFTIGKGTNGAYYLVYQYDSEFFALVPDLKGRI